MLELCFDNSTQGALRSARLQSDSQAATLGSCVAVTCVTEPGKGHVSWLRRRRVLRRVKQEIAERERHAVPLRPAGDVLALSLGLEQGDIRAPLAAECPRKDLLRRWYEEPEERWERLWRDTLTTVACLRSLPAGETLRIWADNRTPHSACGLLFAAELLRDTAAEVRTVCLPPWRERYDGTVVQYGGWGDVCPGEFGCFLPLEQPLPPNALRMLAARWKELKEENAPLRAVVNGEVRSVEETFYDGLIRKHLPAGEKKVAALIGEILGRERPGIGDIWLADRIRAMIAAGELELVREDPERFYRSVIRRGPCRV